MVRLAHFPMLPIDEVLSPLRAALAMSSCTVLQAPAGAGKTTRVPIALMDEPWLGNQRIVMLEPRRLAARAAARRMAASLAERVGERVGFRVRGESLVGARTRIEVVTEGILTRMLQRDPTLDGVGMVVFDEFHERSVHADLGLALTLETQQLIRPELRVLVMSATLDGAAVAALLGGAPIISSAGRVYPVAVHYDPPRRGERLDVVVATAVRHALAREPGSLLVFLPGAREIRWTMQRLIERPLAQDVRIVPLFGALGAAEQDLAIAPSPDGIRKVVLATSIAETSLTIDGVRVVVDAGLSRIPRFSPRTGMTRLETVRVSRAAADQRRGRAGRTAPGVCYRLWAEDEQRGLIEGNRPEILDADLAPLALDLARAGIQDAGTLRWLDAPPAAALAHARELLAQLGALSVDARITPHGRDMARLGAHPRIAHMLLRGTALGIGATACVVAALLEERDLLRAGAFDEDADLRLRMRVVLDSDDSGAAGVDADVLRRVRRLDQLFRRHVGVPADDEAIESDCGAALALAFPDRIAQRRPGVGDRYLLRNGAGAVLAFVGGLSGYPYFVAAESDGQRPYARIFVAAPLDRETLDALVVDQVVREDVISWDDALHAVSAVRRERIGALVLREVALVDGDPELVTSTLLGAITRGEGLALRWSEAAALLRQRLTFLNRHFPGWPDVSDRALVDAAPQWLRPHLVGLRRLDEVYALDLVSPMLALLSWEQRSELDALAPTHVVVPSGSRIRIDYRDPGAPVLAVRLQELFGLDVTPCIGRGRVALTLHLLSPAQRLVQVTSNIAGFWRASYFDVRKELRGRYPKHAWPDDPLRAAPTRRTRPRT